MRHTLIDLYSLSAKKFGMLPAHFTVEEKDKNWWGYVQDYIFCKVKLTLSDVHFLLSSVIFCYILFKISWKKTPSRDILITCDA